MTEREATAIRLATTPYRYPAVRDTHALEQLGLTPSKFWALVHHLADRPDVIAALPMETARLRRLRDARQAARRSGG